MSQHDAQFHARRPAVLAPVVAALLGVKEQAADNLPGRELAILDQATTAIARAAATGVGLAEISAQALATTDDDIAAILMDLDEVLGIKLPWDGSIIKALIAAIPDLIKIVQLIASLL